MNLLFRQIWALIRKNLLIICVRRPVSTFIRALALPLLVVLIAGYSKVFFSSDSVHWGVSSPYEIRSLNDGLLSSKRYIVGFVDNGMTEGDVSSVIDSLSSTVKEAGRIPKLFNNFKELGRACAANTKGVSACYGAVEFLSSPDQGSAKSPLGVWNYTIFGEESSGSVDVRGNNNRPETNILPLQRAVDMEIIARSSNTSTTLPTVKEISFTTRSQDMLLNDRTRSYVSLCANLFGIVFTFAMVGIVYHLTTFVATERQLNISSLIDTMLPGSNSRARLLRQISTYTSFALVYLPSWISVGVVISVVVFPNTSRGLPVGYHICSGLAFTSFSLFGASFFKKSQLSGSIMVIIALVGAVLAQVIRAQSKAMIIILSLLFPSANYVYFITGSAFWELENKKVDLMIGPPDPWDSVIHRQPLYVYWVLVVVQILVYPVLAFYLEQLRFSTDSPGRKFDPPSDAQAPTVTLSNFSKTYRAAFLSRLFKKRKDVHAVTDMNMNAYPGQILCLLGPNGCGKSTTLNCIAGQHKVTSGDITIDPTGGLGYAPQHNVIWPTLTVREHVKIFSDLKCITPVNVEIINELVKSCDLESKVAAQARTLSGGQKRKLQLAMMFAGGSTVCCVDEVSTGLDPISRRRIWEILLAERSRRTIIMTTHFLDEADFLADNIVIMYKGTLKAEGTSATLKNKYGNGYTVKLPQNTDLDIALSGSMEKETVRHQVVYRIADAGMVTKLIEELEKRQICDYTVSGPTMEELFLKATGDNIVCESNSSTSGDHDDLEPEPQATTVTMDASKNFVTVDGHENYQLTEGRPISAFQQWCILFRKRCVILRRRYIPYFIILAVSLVGAGVAPLLIKSFKAPMKCPAQQDLVNLYEYRRDLTGGNYNDYLIGPPSSIDEDNLRKIADIYSTNRTAYYSDYVGFHNVTHFQERLHQIGRYDNFTNYIQEAQKPDGHPSDQYYDRSTYVYTAGGLWLKDTATMLYSVENPASAVQVHNMLNNMLTGVPISAGWSTFPTTDLPTVLHFKPIIFMVYFGLIMACYPAFFALYPTNERISNVRSMQYSNGIRPLPLWLAHLSFDMIFVLVIAAVGVALLSKSTPVWFGLGYVFLIMLLYGLVSALLSYVLSMFAKSAVQAWFMSALGQVVLYFAYFGGMIGVKSSASYGRLESDGNALYFGLGIFSPVVNLERALTIGLGQFATLCNGHSAGSIYLFGGPILYLILQAIILSIVLLWWDSSFTLPSVFSLRRSKSPVRDTEKMGMTSSDLTAELKRLSSSSTDLRVESVSKRFGKNLAVDDVTFGVQTSEIFALLGPNGAGKSTLISMIRGDMKPSTSESSIHIAGHSILSNPVTARANLGVCPQFDSADILTVTETLRFFAQIRGVRDITHNVATVIEACGLAPWAHALAQTLSGGTKRKLSLAVALVGNPRVLVLDEPSSSLDAVSKRKLWTTLQTISKGRAVVLTTHSMEEADALADRIGIVSSRMLALDSRESLKKRAGDAYHIHLVCNTAPRTSAEEIQVLKEWIETTFERRAKINRQASGGQVRFEVPSDMGYGVVELMRVLEGSKEGLGVEFYTVGRATLDEVFENVVRGYST